MIVIRRVIVAAVAVVTMIVTVAASGEPTDRPGSDAGLHVSAEVGRVDLLAAGAIADSFEDGVRRVMVRVVDEMELVVRIEAEPGVTLTEPLYLCLVGPWWAPDDAGLSDRCWGEPDLAALVADQMPTAADGSIRLEARQPIVVSTTVRRGNERCDYPPGQWHLEVGLSPPRTPADPNRVALEDILLEVPWETAEPLRLLEPGDSRYCGLANAALREQGEPEVVTP